MFARVSSPHTILPAADGPPAATAVLSDGDGSAGDPVPAAAAGGAAATEGVGDGSPAPCMPPAAGPAAHPARASTAPAARLVLRLRSVMSAS